jgi:hypothetical protein
MAMPKAPEMCIARLWLQLTNSRAWMSLQSQSSGLSVLVLQTKKAPWGGERAKDGTGVCQGLSEFPALCIAMQLLGSSHSLYRHCAFLLLKPTVGKGLVPWTAPIIP